MSIISMFLLLDNKFIFQLIIDVKRRILINEKEIKTF